MRNLLKLLSVGILVIAVSSCGMMTDDKFVYLGHGDDTPNYQLYYNKTKKLFVLIDKRNGCFQKDNTGECFAFTLKQARDFREKVLSKMIEIDDRLAKDNYGQSSIKKLEEAGITNVDKSIKTEDVYATPVKQIVVDRKEQYLLDRNDFKVNASIRAIVVKGNDGEEKIKVAYAVNFPQNDMKLEQGLRPFIINPKYMYTHMTMSSVHKAQSIQEGLLKNEKDVGKKVDNYLKDVVDFTNKPAKDSK